MRITVTGFEPFGGSSLNASWEAVRRLDGVEKALLPVSFVRAGERIRKIVADGPDAILCVGEAGGRSAVSVERVAVNLMDARIPDNDGAQPVDAPIAPGPAAYFTALPSREIVARMRRAGLPAELSYTAGTYVCNALFYALMHAVSTCGKPIPAGFIHVPAAGMAAEEAARALRIAVQCVGDALRGDRPE